MDKFIELFEYARNMVHRIDLSIHCTINGEYHIGIDILQIKGKRGLLQIKHKDIDYLISKAYVWLTDYLIENCGGC